MFCWILMPRKLFNNLSSNHLYSNHPYYGIQSKRPQARRRKPATRPELQVLEDRTLLSVAVLETPPIVAALEQQAVRVMATEQSEFNGIVQIATTVAKEIVQEGAELRQQWVNLFKDILDPQNQFSNGATLSAGSGSGSGAATTAHNAANQQPNANLQQSGNGSGSGAATTAHDGTPTKGIVKPMVSGTGFGNVQPSGSGVGSGSVTVYTWDPHGYGSGTGHGGGSGNDLASNFHNWLKDGQPQNGTSGTIPGNKSTDEALFDGSVSNAQIEWNQSFTFSTMLIGGLGAYTAEEFLDAGDDLVLTGVDGASMSMTGASGFNLNFADHNQFVEIKQNASITNMDITGYDDDSLIISGGITTIAGNPGAGNPVFTEYLGVQLMIYKGARLNDLGYNALTFTNNNLQITVNGKMYVYYSSGMGYNLIDNGGMTGDYINVDGGTLYYYGSNAVQDTFTVPVWIQNGGLFSVQTDPGAQGSAKLVIKDGSNVIFPTGTKESVYMTGSNSNVAL